VWDKIDQFVLNRVLRFSDGKLARVRLIVVDSGGHCTTEVYRYCSSRRPRVFALKGYGGQGKPIIIGGRTTEKSQSAWLLRIGVDTLKDDFHSRLAMDKPGPGFLHWPRGKDGEEARGYTEAFFAQLLSEQRVLRFSRKGFTRFEWWKQRRAQNEALDLACYNRAALEYLKVRLEAIPRDILALNPEALERIEMGLGQSILVQRAPPKAGVQRRSPHSHTHLMKIEGLENEPEVRVQWTGSAAQGTIPKPQKGRRYGAVGQSF
jgi:phage terminase large subunit GpA-like protein